MRETAPLLNFTVVVTSLIDLNADIRRMTIDWAKRQADIGYEFGSTKMILVPGEYVWEEQEVPPKVQWGWAVEGIREIADYANGLGIQTGLEFETPKHNIINSVDSLNRMLDDVGRPYVQANVDFVHMYVVGDAPETLEKLRGRLLNVHFADCKGRKHAHWPPGSGVVPLKDYLGPQGHRLYRSDPDGAGVVARACQDSRVGQGRHYSTARMMKELGMRD